jgi:hypothetical protein
MELLPRTFYGYPIDKWDVSQLEVVTEVFEDMKTCSGYIGSWYVSNMTDITNMFRFASAFNQCIWICQL